MIKAQHGVTVVTLSLAGTAFTLVQTGTGSLKNGDDTSATKLLTATRDAILDQVKYGKALVAQAERVLPKLAGFKIPASVIEEGKSHVTESKKALERINQDLAEVEQILVYARQYDTEVSATKDQTNATAQAAAERIDLEDLVDAVIGKMFGNKAKPHSEKIVMGCGEEGCPGCGGHKVFEFNPESLFEGLRHQPNGVRGTDQAEDLVKALRQSSRPGFRTSDLPKDMPEGLRKALQDGHALVFSIADRDEEAEGLSGLMEHIFGTRANRYKH